MHRGDDRPVRTGDQSTEGCPVDVNDARRLGFQIGGATGLICILSAMLTMSPLGIFPSMLLVVLCAAGGILTAFFVGYRRFPHGLTPPASSETGKTEPERPMRFWRAKTFVLRRQHPDGTTDEIIRHESEGQG